jgi:hypothetical protein
MKTVSVQICTESDFTEWRDLPQKTVRHGHASGNIFSWICFQVIVRKIATHQCQNDAAPDLVETENDHPLQMRGQNPLAYTMSLMFLQGSARS